MHINLETPEHHAIQAYSDHQIQINSTIYTSSLIVSKQEIITELEIKATAEINDGYIELLLKYKPEIVIIGQTNPKERPALATIAYLSQQGIGMEMMSIGAACRTYNVLLGEERAVVIGIFLVER